MEAKNTKPHFTGFAKKIVEKKLLCESAMASALETSRAERSALIPYLVKNKLADANLLAKVASDNFGLPLLNFDSFDKDLLPKGLIKNDLMQRCQIIPLFKRGDHLYIGISDPTQYLALDEIKFHTGLITHGIIIAQDQLSKAIDALLSQQEETVLKNLEDTNLEAIDILNEDERLEESKFTIEKEDAPIVRFVHKILLDAMNKVASDIHFEPYERSYRIRMRLDGVLQEFSAPPIALASRISARIKVMSRLDISERRIPQDGRFKINVSAKRAIDFRVSTCPTVNGEKVVVRLLDPGSATMGIEALGFDPKQKELYLNALKKTQGMILVTGPTGSGKTVTLYTGLNILNTTAVNISTVEDPVELHIAGINQVNINLKAGLTFASVLRSFLRQDPDIIMVGEMRDLETAEIGVKAAQTGHLVLSTLHTNSAAESLTRLANMGLPAYNIATSLMLIIAQRLARRLCPACRITVRLPTEILLEQGFKENEVDDLQIYAPAGCDQCNQGYKGRIGLYEILLMNDTLSAAILEGKNSLELLKLAKSEGMQTLREAGLAKVKQGLTSLEEINRVTQD